MASCGTSEVLSQAYNEGSSSNSGLLPEDGDGVDVVAAVTAAVVVPVPVPEIAGIGAWF